MKVYHRDDRESHRLTASTNPITRHPFMPSRQLCTTWAVEAWDKVPESLINNPGMLVIIKKSMIYKKIVKMRGKRMSMSEMKIKLLSAF